MKRLRLISVIVVLCGCSSDSGESDTAKATQDGGTSKLAAAVAGKQSSGEGSAAIPAFSSQDPLSPEVWKSAIGSAIPASADAVKIVRTGQVLTFATSVKAGRSDFDYAQPIDGDFTLTVKLGVRSAIASRAVSSTIPTGAWFQVHPPSDRNRHAAAPIYLTQKNGTAVIQVLRSGTRVQCVSQGKLRGGGDFDGPIQFGVWLNGAGEIDVHDFTLEEAAPQLLAHNSTNGSGGFGNPTGNPFGGPPPGFAGGPPGFGPGQPAAQGGFGGPAPGMQNAFGGAPPGAQGGFGGPQQGTQAGAFGQPLGGGPVGNANDASAVATQQARPTTNAILALAEWEIPRSVPQHQHDAIRNAVTLARDAKGLRVRRNDGAPYFPLHFTKLLEGNFIAKLHLVVPASGSTKRAAVRVALRQRDLADTLLATALPKPNASQETEHVVTFERYGQEAVTLIGDKQVMKQKIDGPVALQLILQQELDFWIKSIEVGPFSDAELAKRQKLEGEPLVTQALPAPVDKVVIAGGGKYLLLHFKQIGKLGLYDVEQQKIARVLSLRGDPFIAAGAEHVVVISETNGVIGRLRLSDFTVEARGKVPPEFNILNIAMGSASAGPVLVAVAGRGGSVSAKFLDLQTLTPVEMQLDEKFGAGWSQVGELRASASGQVFSVSGRQPRLIVAGGTDVMEQTHTGFFSLVPGPLGQTVFTDKGLCNSQLKLVAPTDTVSPMIPAATGPFFLSVGVTSESKGSEPAGDVALHVLPSRAKIAEFKDLSIRVSQTSFRSGSLPLDQRLVLHPASGTIVALARTKDKLLVKRFDAKPLLDKTNSDYLLVTSQPPPAVKAGQDYHYQLEVLAKSDEVDYELTSGPEGMTVSPGGLVSWQAKASQAGTLQHVVTSVQVPGGESVYHTFAIKVIDDTQLAASSPPRPATTPKPPPASTVAATPTPKPPPSAPMPEPAATETPSASAATGYGDADVAREPPSKYLPPKVFGFDIPSGKTTLPEDERVTTTNDYGEGVVAKVYATIGENRVVMLPNGKLVAKSIEESPRTERPFRPATRKQITDQLDERFPGFARNATRHFSYVYNTTPNFYTGTSRILETMLPGLKKFAGAHGIKTHNPEVPLVVIIFRTEAQFKLYGAPAGALAYYDTQTNEIVMYEQSPLWKVDPELAFKDTIATIAHEGAHQILANIGVQKRLSMWPMWLSEGLAEYVSPTSFGKNLRWKGAGATHDLRMSTLEFYFKLRGEETDAAMIASTASKYRLTSAGYASAWAMTHYLATTEKEAFAAHLREVAQREPFESPGDLVEPGVIPQNLKLFTKHFGNDLPEMEGRLIEHLKKLPYDPPFADRPHVVGLMEWKVDGKRKRNANVFRVLAQAETWLDDRRKSLAEAGVPRATVSIREYANRHLAERDVRQFLGR